MFYSQKSYSQKLGTCTQTISQAGCFIVSDCNLFPRLIDFKMTPPELNEYCKKNGFYSNGCLLNSEALAKKLGMTYKKTTTKPSVTCIAETDHYKTVGVPQHFFMWKPDGTIIDPLDLKPDWKKCPYKIVSWRVFKSIQTQPETVQKFYNGVDISHWQENVDFTKLKQDFVIHKCTEGTNYIDPHYKERQKHIQGSYHFARGGDAIKEADWYWSNCGNEQLVLDWEIEHADPVGWSNKFMERLKEKGRTCWLYTNDARALKYSWPKDWTFWIARYKDYTGDLDWDYQPKHNWAVWQYTSRGKVEGIEGNVDRNVSKIPITSDEPKTPEATLPISEPQTPVLEPSTPLELSPTNDSPNYEELTSPQTQAEELWDSVKYLIKKLWNKVKTLLTKRA